MFNDNKIKVDEIMRQIRNEVIDKNKAYEEITNNQNNLDLEVENRIKPYIDEAQMRSMVGASLPPMHKLKGIKRSLAKFIGKIFLRVAQLITRDQRIVNQNLVVSIRVLEENQRKVLKNIEHKINREIMKTQNQIKEEISNEVSAIERRVEEKIANEIAAIESRIEEKIAHQISTIENRIEEKTANEASAIESRKEKNLTNKIRNLEDRINTTFSLEAAKIESKITGLIKGKFNNLDQIAADKENGDKINSLENYQLNLKNIITEVENKVSKLSSQIAIQERRLTLLLEEARKRLPADFNEEQLMKMNKELKHLNDQVYLDFENQFRGTREEIKERLKYYLPFIKETEIDYEKSKIIDIGSGRGEWLELLNEEGISVQGIDLNKVMVEELKQKDYDVVFEDALNFLSKVADNSVGAVTGFHIIEHFKFEYVINLLREAIRVIKPGGLLILETPNPKNLIVGACNFYSDPTHLNPVHPDTLTFLVESQGFVNVEINHWSQGRADIEEVDYGEITSINLKVKEIDNIISEWFKSPPDYAVIARKA